MKLVALILLLSFSLHAEDLTSAWLANGHFVEENESQRMTNGFGGRLDFTQDAGFLNGWHTNWTSISTIKHPEGVYIVMFVTARDGERQDSVFDLTIKKPDGTVANNFTNLTAVRQSARPVSGPDALGLKLAKQFTIFQLDPPDPLGTYTVEVELRDRLQNRSVKLKKSLVVTN